MDLYGATLERAEQVLSTLAKLDLADRHVTVEERTIAAVEFAIVARLRDLGVDARQENVRMLMGRHLRALA